MSYRQITFAERYTLALLRQQGLSAAAMARVLGRHRSTVGREIQRNRGRSDGAYRPPLADWYARERVPFDPALGFEPERVIRSNRLFAVTHGLVPLELREISAAANAGDPEPRRLAAARLATLYASLGLYERALRLDRTTLAAHPANVPARRRMVWSLLRLGRFEDARDEAAPLAQTEDALSRAIADVAREAPAAEDAELRASRIARLPVLTRAEVPWVLAGTGGAEARTVRSAARDTQRASASSESPGVGGGAREP